MKNNKNKKVYFQFVLPPKCKNNSFMGYSLLFLFISKIFVKETMDTTPFLIEIFYGL